MLQLVGEMSVYNLLKSGAVLVGLATGSAAIAAGINGIGSYFSGDPWAEAAGAVRPLPKDARIVRVAEGGTVSGVDFSLFEGGSAVQYVASAHGRFVVPAALAAGAGVYDYSFDDPVAGRGAPFMFRTGLGALASANERAQGSATQAAASDLPAAMPALFAGGFGRALGGPQGGADLERTALEGAPADDASVPAQDPLVTARIAPVPLPAGAALLLTSLLGLGSLRRARRG
ncbi:hypothetical protein [Rhodovulum euryhalinum]|nr:hypothetical protein [Rhodovulum euryhalinum]